MFRFCKKLSVLGLLKVDRYIVNKGTYRHFFSPLILNLLEFDKEQTIWQRKVGRAKGKFIARVEEALEKDGRIFTEDIKALCYLADSDNEFKLAIRSMDKYLEIQSKSSFQTLTHNVAGALLLSMLHMHKQDELAYSWFIDEKCNVHVLGRHKECFMLIMDLMYDCGRHQDVVSLMTQADQYMDRKYADLVTITLASLYTMNSPDSLGQLQTFLNELCMNPIQLSSRSAMYCAMLAFKQGDVDMTREVLHLPLFTVCSRRKINTLPNIEILTLIEIGRLEDAVDILKDAVLRFKKSAQLFFPEVLQKLESAVKTSTNVRLKDEFKVVYEALKFGDFIYPFSMEDFMSKDLRYKEHEMLMNTSIPKQLFKQSFSYDRKSKHDNNLIGEPQTLIS